MNENIPGHPGYHVTTDGKVYSNKRGGWTPLKSCLNHGGYRIVHLSNSRRTTISIHRLVLLAYVGPRPEGMGCRHLDGNKLNNNLSNLKWGTALENSNDKTSHGTRPLGSETKANTFKEEDIPKVFEKYIGGQALKSIAREYKVSPGTVKSALTRKTWKHIDIDADIILAAQEKIKDFLIQNPQNVLSQDIANKIFNRVRSNNYINIKELIGEFGFSYSTYTRLFFSKTRVNLREKANFVANEYRIKPPSGIFDEDVLLIFDLYLAGSGLFKLAKRFGCDKKTIKKIITRKHRTDIIVDPAIIEECQRLLSKNREIAHSYVKKT